MLTKFWALMAGTGKLGIRTIAFVAILIAAGVFHWLTPLGCFLAVAIVFGCWWFGLIASTAGDDSKLA